METPRHRRLIYALLGAAWALVVGWQVAEHFRVERTARAELINRAKDISTTVGIVLRSQRRFGVISKERLESALTELVRPAQLSAVALLNAAGEVVASAGTPGDLQARGAVRPAELWEHDSVTLMNLVDLGTSIAHEPERTNPPIILSMESFTNRPPPGAQSPPETEAASEKRLPPPPFPPEFRPGDTNGSPFPATNRFRSRGGEGRPRFGFGRPPWMSEAEYKAMLEKKGVHSFVIVLSAQSVRAATQRDIWLRAMIAGLAGLSVLGLGFAWRNLAQTADLQIRLVRASELNSHLKQMNLAAAGLAHETRNPLNLIRGLAQMISKTTEAPAATRQKAGEIVNEADRVAAQLNEFINYSRPREVRRATLQLNAVTAEVVRALTHDLEEKQIRLHVTGDPLAIEADEQLLRQVLFNLVLNAIQAVTANGAIEIHIEKSGALEARLEVRDNGPGVPAENRAEIFKPYFTTTQQGTGLGLAVVQQIVLAHGWEIECRANAPQGAIFRLTHLKLALA
ncbi:MAG: ATP-binding protein [Verrucomicrobiota bacterium]